MAKRQRKKRRHVTPSVSIAREYDVDAPPFAVDSVVIECCRKKGRKKGIFAGEVGTLIIPIRKAVILAGRIAADFTELAVNHPEHVRRAKMLCKDLERIGVLFKRIGTIDPKHVALVAHSHSAGALPGDDDEQYEKVRLATEILQDYLKLVDLRVESYLQDIVVPRYRGGHHDPLGSTYIDRMADAMTKALHRPMKRKDLSWFQKLLAAGWRDLKFPVADRKGESREPLERWFADRARKQLFGN